MTKRSKKGPYRNRADRAAKDMNWDWSDDGYEYAEAVPKRLTRNKIDGVWGGVCAGIGDYTGLDPVIVRILFVLSFFFLLGPLAFVIYFGLCIFVPTDNRAPYKREKREARRAKREAAPNEAPARNASFKDVKSKFRSIETRLADMEKSITSSEWQLRRQFRDLEN